MLTYEELITKHRNNAERLAFIDFMIRFTGRIKRSQIGEQFNLSAPAATKLLSEYNKICPMNMFYDHSQRTNVINSTYQPLLKWDSNTVLEMIANGFNKNKLLQNKQTILPFEHLSAISHIPIKTVEIITQAINCRKAIKCEYFSKNSNNENVRVLVPLCIIYDGDCWMFRAYDRSETSTSKNKFKFFHFARIINIDVINNENQSERQVHEEITHDIDWNTELPLSLKIHDELDASIKKEIRIDFRIKEDSDELIVIKRAAFWWILKRKWFIDTISPNKEKETESSSPSKKGFYKFRLYNKDMIEMILLSKNCFTKL